MATCLIGLGSNLGKPDQNLDAAAAHLEKWDGAERLQVSDWVQTAPVGGPEGQSTFANGALRLETNRTAREVLEQLLETEQTLGRERRTRWGPRTADLDLLLYDDLRLVEEGLTVPHPWMAIRRFVLQPAVQVAAEMIHPEIGWTIQRLWENLQAANYIAIAGVSAGSVQETVAAAAEDAGATFVSAPVTDGSQLAETVKFPSARAEKSSQTSKEFLVTDFWNDKPFAEDPTPNLVVALTNTAAIRSDERKCEQEELFARVRKSGPFLFLDAKDLGRLQHDLAAAISGMRSKT